jgi:hypothetical protein
MVPRHELNSACVWVCGRPIGSAVPVIEAGASPARNAVSAAVAGLSPDQIALQVMPSSAVSSAVTLVRPADGNVRRL